MVIKFIAQSVKVSALGLSLIALQKDPHELTLSGMLQKALPHDLQSAIV